MVGTGTVVTAGISISSEALGAVISGFFALLSAAFAYRTRREEARREKETREEERRSEAKKVLDKYRGPLLDAAWQLGNRIDNIRHRGFLDYLSTERAHDARLTTLFRFAQYFGWRDVVRGEVQLLRFENEDDTRLVAGFLNDAGAVFSSYSLGGAILWDDEQRGIGELMTVQRPGASSTVRGHAAFCQQYDRVFAPWMERLAQHALSSDAPESYRLRLLQWALFGLARRLDEERAFGPSEWMDRAEEETKDHPRDPDRIVEFHLLQHLDLLRGWIHSQPTDA